MDANRFRVLKVREKLREILVDINRMCNTEQEYTLKLNCMSYDYIFFTDAISINRGYPMSVYAKVNVFNKSSRPVTE